MRLQSVLRKMISEQANPVHYFMDMEEQFIYLNQFLGHAIAFKHVGYCCLSCGNDEPIFRQGFCKKCFFENARAGDWILYPEKSTAHLDIEDRDLVYERQVQLQPHVVYLAFSSGLKVGVTRAKQIPTRWIDQGALQAIELVRVPNRYLAGITEVALKEHMTDKTNFRQMLIKNTVDINLIDEKHAVQSLLPKEVRSYYVERDEIYTFQYPLSQQLQKPKTINLEKLPQFEKKLIGIKGQYLIFDDQSVLNVRNYEGFVVELTLSARKNN